MEAGATTRNGLLNSLSSRLLHQRRDVDDGLMAPDHGVRVRAHERVEEMIRAVVSTDPGKSL
jgi:hypothetical protein